MSKTPTLDPMLQPALQLEHLPVIPARMGVLQEADTLTGVLERLASRASIESDRQGAAQLMNAAEALSVIVVSLVAYSRGRVPQLSHRKPDIVVS
jgi:hypothetical protein